MEFRGSTSITTSNFVTTGETKIWQFFEEYLVRVSMTCEIGFKMPIQTIFGQVSSVKKEANESLSQFHSLGTQ